MKAVITSRDRIDPARATTLVSFHAVSKSFQVGTETHQAVFGIDLDIRVGEFVTLVGPSGCGKSTLLNMVAGMFSPTTGQVLYKGDPVTDLNRRVGYMTQQDYLLPWRSVADNVGLPLEIKGMPAHARAERIEELIALVGLKGFEKHYPAQVSGGMRKRCALARLLAQDPETLLMDEPFGALDAQLRLALQGELLDICRKLGKTVVFVTHDLDEAVGLADRCAVFHGRPGTIIEVLDIDLPRERDLIQMRFAPRYIELTRRLWHLMAPDLGHGGRPGEKR